jgi:thioredoxin reductase (NADPH)
LVVETADLDGAFPRLSDSQLAAIVTHAERRPTRVGEVLFRQDDRPYDFFVVTRGTVAVAVVSDAGTDDERVFAVQAPVASSAS